MIRNPLATGPLFTIFIVFLAFASCTRDLGNQPPKKWIVSTIAGSDIAGYKDGDKGDAQFAVPISIYADNHGNLYVGDIGAHGSIRQVTYAGRVTTYMGNGQNDPDPVLGNVAAIVGDGSGNMYIVDYDWIRRIQSPTNSAVIAGTLTIGYQDGTGSAARFNLIWHMTSDDIGNLYLPDYDMTNHPHIRKVTPAGVVSTLNVVDNTGYPDTAESNSQFNFSIAADASGNLYISSDSCRLVKKIDPAGKASIFAGAGTDGFTDGIGTSAQFSLISGLACDREGNLWVADNRNYAIRRVSPDGTVKTIAGLGTMGFAEGDSSQAMFKTLTGLTVDKNGTVFILDAGNHRVRKLEYK
jgi:hypothetical protein